MESIENNNYRFSLGNLPRTDSSRNAYTYTISETEHPDGYIPPQYFDSDGEPIRPGGSSIQSGGTIVNAVATYELPQSGGPGTTLIYLLGLMLTGFAGAGIVLRKKERN